MNAFSEKEIYSSSLIFYSILLFPVYHNFDYVFWKKLSREFIEEYQSCIIRHH